MKKKSLLVFLAIMFSLPLWSDDFSFMTRLQLDASGKYAESRLRVDVQHGFEPSYNPVFNISGFETFYPVEWLGVCAGNSFFKKYPVKGAWLSASDSYLKTGRLLKSGAGILGRFQVSDQVRLNLSFSGSPESWNEADEMEIDSSEENQTVNLNAGEDLLLFDMISVGSVFYKMNGPSPQVGVYAGFSPDEGPLKGLLFNAGYIHNFRDSYMAKSKDALMCSLGYEMKDSGLGFYGDLISGLNNQYLNKSGKVKNHSVKSAPFYTAVRLSYEPVKSLVLNLSGNYASFYDDSEGGFGFKASSEYKISKQFGTLEGGIEYKKEMTEAYVIWKMKIAENK
ncbi:MAG: hypothetical protein MJ181_02780 [Treponema sp.]|nr:hypothetical protein [Treponema sp.]